MVRDRVRAGDVSFGHHWRHGAEQHFGVRQMREVVLNGQVIDWMRDRQRLLFCCRVRNRRRRWVWLHVVVDYINPELAGLVTAYVPDPTQWEEPPLRRRR
jgi:hypothetical protein